MTMHLGGVGQKSFMSNGDQLGAIEESAAENEEKLK